MPSETSAAVQRVALVGSPNAGKTTLFNALTGLRAKTANYPSRTPVPRNASLIASVPRRCDHG